VPRKPDIESIRTWRKRIDAAEELHKSWDKKCRVQDCYDYWAGDQLQRAYDEFGQRRAQVNKIHASVQNTIPSLYFYRPYVRIEAAPEKADDPKTRIQERTDLLQDTVNHLVRNPETQFRPATFLALKEAQWAMGVVEVGYSAKFVEAPMAERPELKEKKDTVVNAKAPDTDEPPTVDQDGLSIGPDSELEAMQAEVRRLQGQIEHERFYVKHIPAKQLLVSVSDKPTADENDWIGYWEEMPLQDVKKTSAYKNTKNLKAGFGTDKDRAQQEKYKDMTGETETVRLIKIWNLRTMERFVMADNHDHYLLRATFQRNPLKTLRFDVDPYHFYPRPPILPKLGSQDEYNQSREYLRQIRIGTVPRYTYDEDAVSAQDMKKLERGAIGAYIKRREGSVDPITPINQPSFSENAIQTLTLSDKEFEDVGGTGGSAKVSQEASATQAKIANTKLQVQDSFERGIVADWLAEIAQELLSLAIENMNIQQWIAVNVTPDSMFAGEIAQGIQQDFEAINADKLTEESTGLRWNVSIDIESLSPVSEEEKFQKWMVGLQLMANPDMAMLFAASPELLRHTLDLLGLKAARDQDLILEAMKAKVNIQMQQAQAGQQPGPGISGQPEVNPTPQTASGGGPQPASQ